MLTKAKNERMGSTQVMIAALNEEKGVGLTIAEIKAHLYEPKILVIDGNSIDRTVEVAKNRGADVLYQTGLGKGDALAAGINYLPLDVDFVILTDADYTYPAEYVPEMIRILQENPQVGMVCGNRFNHVNNSSSFNTIFSFGNKLIAFTYNLLTNVKLEDPLSGLRAVRADLLRNWHVKSKGFDIEVELNRHVERCGYTIIELPIHYRVRIGQKKLKVSDGAKILKRIMTESTY